MAMRPPDADGPHRSRTRAASPPSLYGRWAAGGVHVGGASSRDPGSGSCMAAMRRIKARAEGSDVSVGSPGCLPWGSCHIGKVVTI